MSDIQTKRLITWRVDPDLLKRIDERARELDRSRSAFLTWAAENALDDTGRGVPELPRQAPAGVRAAAAAPDVRVVAGSVLPVRWVGCREHPDVGAVRSRGQMWCAEPGCTRSARREA